jgi:hypothetical protein
MDKFNNLDNDVIARIVEAHPRSSSIGTSAKISITLPTGANGDNVITLPSGAHVDNNHNPGPITLLSDDSESLPAGMQNLKLDPDKNVDGKSQSKCSRSNDDCSSSKNNGSSNSNAAEAISGDGTEAIGEVQQSEVFENGTHEYVHRYHLGRPSIVGGEIHMVI